METKISDVISQPISGSINIQCWFLFFIQLCLYITGQDKING